MKNINDPHDGVLDHKYNLVFVLKRRLTHF